MDSIVHDQCSIPYLVEECIPVCQELGFDCGIVDGIAGAKFTSAVNAYQKSVLGYKSLDGEVTAGKKMWKSLLGML